MRTRLPLATAIVSTALALSGCDNTNQHEPSASDVSWKLERTANHKGYLLTGGATYAKGLSGWYEPVVVLHDDRGCQISFVGQATQIADPDSTGTVTARFDSTFNFKRPVATADFSVVYDEAPAGSTDVNSIRETPLFFREVVLDPSLHPPETPTKPCSPPLTADQRLERMSQNQQVAEAIKSAGFLCARVTDLYPDSAGQIIAHCVKYQSGRGRAVYRIDADAGRVEETE